MPILPPAPPRFSTITGLPSASPSGTLISRAAMSVPPPAGKHTIMVIWRSGYSARTPAGASAAAAARMQPQIQPNMPRMRLPMLRLRRVVTDYASALSPRHAGHSMTSRITIDVHAHILPEETIRLLGGQSSRVAPKLIQENGALIMEIAGKVVQRPMPREIFDLDLRLRDMDQHGVTMQILSTAVHTFFYDEEPALAAACATLQNDQIAAAVDRHADRFLGLATLPLQDPARA